MTELDLHAITERYHLALDAKPGKGSISPDGIAAITDSVADIPQLLAELEGLRKLICELTDPDPCWFDHHGGCQAHGYLSLEPGETCPMFDAQRVATLTEGMHQ